MADWTIKSEYEGRNYVLARLLPILPGGLVQGGLPVSEKVTLFLSVSAATTLTFAISPNRGVDTFACGTLTFAGAGTDVLTINEICNWVSITTSGAIVLTAIAVVLPLPREV